MPEPVHYLQGQTVACGHVGAYVALRLEQTTCQACLRAVHGFPEAALLREVRKAAGDYGYLCYHTWRSDHSEQGFPDVVLCRPGRLIFAELKTQRGKLTMAQQRWLTTLEQVPGIEVVVWRPADLTALRRRLAGEPDGAD